MPAKGKTSGAKAPAKKTTAKPKSSSAKAKAKAQTPSPGVDALGAEAPQTPASMLEDREPIPRKAVKPKADVSACAIAPGAPAPMTASSSFICPEETQSKPDTMEEYLATLGVEYETTPEPVGTTSRGQASMSDA
ncbi:hypothetical protein BBJ28_00027127 [Nothophytophthora sp. Chile5]|nr:hypothetical protein BBJ28_00027127 [Nothophytophthora sp. Chile5]